MRICWPVEGLTTDSMDVEKLMAFDRSIDLCTPMASVCGETHSKPFDRY